MPRAYWLAVRCKLSTGIFSSERAFEVTLANGEKHSGPAPLHFCWNAQGKPLGPDEALADEADGWVAARPVGQELSGDQVALEVPDGEVIAVRTADVRPSWTQIHPTQATA
jgi:hypothetical protein